MEMVRVSSFSAPSGIYVQVVKPLFDLVLGLTLLLLTSPLLIVVPILIKLDSKGPVIFKQQRYGKHGRIFDIYKFRTMYTDVPKEGRSPVSGKDPRITSIGRMLRKTSIDELPQLFNILRGEMSFIGPRPEQRSIVETEYSDWERQRFCVTPGITGLWQISPERIHPIHENLHYDFKYAREVSWKMDAKIIWGTLAVVIKSNTV
ncbi:sugar transferase [Paenibacillus roseipurpureus]|uniref:Sugar transferase n=1 Tax=Paenibacillus roseopurpureus TaxID=2918901 RepID=A0AA96LL63_9BACL|nr:sugar transferase [Paenibacillus sp. MBLB1832]WNR43770.1 sugar transferase [Paenibacillus sp. MBLB1832]